MQRRSVQRVDPHYKQKRTLNNISVQKSREKSRRECKETMKSIEQLEQDNEHLLKNLQTLKQEYEELRNLFQQHTGIDIDQMASSTITNTTSELSTSSKEESKESSSKPILTINTTEDQSSSSNPLDANNLDGSVVLINGVQYKIVSINKD